MSITQLPTLRAFCRAEAQMLSDDDLIAEQRAFAAARRLLDAGAAAVASEIDHRSRRELGNNGLAQSRGVRTGDALIAQVTGLSSRDARTMVRIGSLVADPEPWMEPVADAVATGGLSLDGADVIRAGLGQADDVSVEALADAAAKLADAASTLSLEQLAREARDARTELDVAGVADREKQLRDRRFLSLTPLPDGMTRVSGLLDPESAAIIVGAVDAITGPRRGGPRFVDPTVVAQPTEDDVRMIPQMMADALVDIVRLAVTADRSGNRNKLFGRRGGGLRVHVSHRDLSSGLGFGHIEGQTAAVSVQTCQRIACDEGVIPLVIDTAGQVLNVGRALRTHTPPMRLALAARDGGCVMPGCGRPPQWCEAHHINEWSRDHGDTSVEDGVLLCRHHHQLLHDREWKISRVGGTYWLTKPDGTQTRLTRSNPIVNRVHPPG